MFYRFLKVLEGLKTALPEIPPLEHCKQHDGPKAWHNFGGDSSASPQVATAEQEKMSNVRIATVSPWRQKTNRVSNCGGRSLGWCV